VPRGKLDSDHPSEAVACNDGLVDADLGAEPREIVGEVGDGIAIVRTVAAAATAQIERRDGMRACEVVELRLERGAVATPAVDKEQFGLSAAGPLVVQLEALEVRVRHDDGIVS
jgi:hypothetical protein